MRIEPVYLLAPKPKPPSMPTRRAFLFAGGTFIAGIGLGGACGYAAAHGGTTAGPGDDQIDLPLTGDETLDELRRLAIKAPIEELTRKGVLFIEHLRASYREDAILWRGAHRLGTELIQNPAATDRRRIANWLAQVATQSSSSLADPTRSLIPQLRRLR